MKLLQKSISFVYTRLSFLVIFLVIPFLSQAQCTIATLNSLASGSDYDNTYDRITSVNLNNVTRSSGVDANSGVSLGTTMSVTRGMSYTMTVQVQEGYVPDPEYNVTVWFDWNGDGVFATSGENVDFGWQSCANGGTPTTYTFTATIVVPTTASINATSKMRVGLDYYRQGLSGSVRSGALSCGYASLVGSSGQIGNRVGDYEDYTLDINTQTGPGGVGFGNTSSNKLWLKADDLSLTDGTLVSTWTDASGANHNATQTLTNRPTFKTSIVNTRPVVRFDGVDDLFSSVLSSTTTNNTIFTVFAHDHPGNANPKGPLWQLDQTDVASGFWPMYNDNKQYIGLSGGSYMSQTSTFTRNAFTEATVIRSSGNTTIFKNGTSNQTTAANAETPNSFRIGYDGADYYKGDIAEIAYYNYTLNTAQRTIVENYLAAKYGLTISNDKYAYESTHSYEVAGIGYEDASNIHANAVSADIMYLSNASSLNTAGDYLLFGHNNASTTAWTTTNRPDAVSKRIAREWRFSESGSVGTVTLTIDTTLLLARETDYTSVVLMIDADGDFTSGASVVTLTAIGNNQFKADNLTLGGQYVTIGISQNRTIASGNFSSTSVWSSGVAPTTGTLANIMSGHSVTLTANHSVGSLTVFSGGTLSLGTYQLTIDKVGGSLTNNGTFNTNTGTVAYSAAGAQTINALSVNNLTIGGSGTKTMAGTVTVSGLLTLGNSTVLNTGGGTGFLNLDLTTGAIDKQYSGSISGNMTVLRTISIADWHYISSPLQGTTYDDLIDDNSLAKFYVYDEPNLAWKKLPTTGGSTLLSSLQYTGGPTNIGGYALKFTGSSTVLDMNGTYNHGAASYSSGTLSYTSSGTAATKGWHLMGNPYPSYIDWNSGSITKTNLNAGISFYNATAGQNADYIPSPEAYTNGASPYIPAMQAFWVQTNATSASLTIGNNARVLSPNVTTPYAAPSFYRNSSYIKSLKVALENERYSDEIVVRFFDQATDQFDGNYDVYKNKNELPCPSLYTGIQGEELSINSLSELTSSKEVPLSMEVPSFGLYTLSLKSLQNFEVSGSVVLIDKKLNTMTDLTKDSTYLVTLDELKSVNRFSLLFGTTNLIASANEALGMNSVTITANKNVINTQFSGTAFSKATIIVTNMLGKEVMNVNNVDVSSGLYSLTTTDNSTGIFIVKVITNQGIYTEKVMLSQGE